MMETKVPSKDIHGSGIRVLYDATPRTINEAHRLLDRGFDLALHGEYFDGIRTAEIIHRVAERSKE